MLPIAHTGKNSWLRLPMGKRSAVVISNYKKHNIMSNMTKTMVEKIK